MNLNLSVLIRTWFEQHPKYTRWTWDAGHVWYKDRYLLRVDMDLVPCVRLHLGLGSDLRSIHPADPTLFEQIEARIEEIISMKEYKCGSAHNTLEKE